MTTTTFELGGYKIIKQLGVVRGITVRSRSVFGTIGGSLQTLFGGNITLFSELCEGVPGLFGLFIPGESLIVSVTASRS